MLARLLACLLASLLSAKIACLLAFVALLALLPLLALLAWLCWLVGLFLFACLLACSLILLFAYFLSVAVACSLGCFCLLAYNS